MVAAETKKMNSNKVNGVKMEGQRVPAKIQKVMAVGSPRNRGQDIKVKQDKLQIKNSMKSPIR